MWIGPDRVQQKLLCFIGAPCLNIDFAMNTVRKPMLVQNAKNNHFVTVIIRNSFLSLVFCCTWSSTGLVPQVRNTLGQVENPVFWQKTIQFGFRLKRPLIASSNQNTRLTSYWALKLVSLMFQKMSDCKTKVLDHSEGCVWRMFRSIALLDRYFQESTQNWHPKTLLFYSSKISKWSAGKLGEDRACSFLATDHLRKWSTFHQIQATHITALGLSLRLGGGCMYIHRVCLFLLKHSVYR